MKISGTKYDRRTRLTDRQKKDIRNRFKKENISIRKLAKEFNVSHTTIRRVLNPEISNSEKAKELKRNYARANYDTKTNTERKRKTNEYKKKLIEDDEIKNPGIN